MASAAKVDACTIVLVEACARNVPVELHHHANANDLCVGRSRMLDLDEEGVYLDSLQSSAAANSPARGAPVVVYLHLNGTRYSFRSRVLRTACPVQLNDRTRVRGLCLARPTGIEEGQRRADYRVSLCTVDLPHVELHEVDAHDPGICAVDAPRFQGDVIDLSRGGICLRVAASQSRSFEIGECFFIRSEFPDGSGTFVLPAQVRHVQRILDGEASRIGLRFLTWMRHFTHPIRHHVAQYCADVERRSLRRRR